MSSIFLCHNQKDKPFVRKLAAQLRRYGAKVWVDEAEIKVGESLIEKIQEGIAEMEYLGVVLSPNSVKSKWVTKEVEIALTEEINGKKVKVIPILVRKCEIPGFLRSKLYADFTSDKKWEDALTKVVDTLGIDRRDKERVPGKKMITVEDFRRIIKEYFSPRPVQVEFFEDWSGIEFIKVDNGDGTFELFEFYTKPTHIDLINEIFRKNNEPKIKDIEVRESYICSQKEMDAFHRSLIKKYNFPEDSYAGQWQEKSEKDDNCRIAWDEWMEWIDGKMPIAFLYDEKE